MITDSLATVDYLAQSFHCDPQTGVLLWRTRPVTHFTGTPKRSAVWINKLWNSRFAGAPAGFVNASSGYAQVKLDNVSHQAHRVVWALCHGTWPHGEIDHINGKKADNRISNLRVVTRTENNRNAKRRADNSSGVTGVCWDPEASKWAAHIRVNGRQRKLGRFYSLQEATAARQESERRYSFHPNHGRAI